MFHQAFSSSSNYLVLILKKPIWSNKFKEIKNLSIVGFKNYLGYTLSDLKLLYDFKNKSAAFNVWNDLLVLVPEADTDKQADHGHLLPPPRVQHLLVPAGQARDPHDHLSQAQLIPPDQEDAGCGLWSMTGPTLCTSVPPAWCLTLPSCPMTSTSV